MDYQKVKAVVFDLDGTLLDTVRDIGTGANVALCRYGFPEHPLDAYRGFVGHGIRELFRQIVPKGIDDETFEQALRFYLDYYPEHCTDHTVYFPGIQDMLHVLMDNGYALAVLSNKTERTAVKIMQHYFSEIPFRFVWGNNGQRPLKPATEAAVPACKELGVSPEEILFFGDGDTDMEFASRSGFVPVACSWGYRSREQLIQAGAAVVVDSTEEFLKLLNLAK
jgi:phosphoglycolate phosphatase